MVSSAQAAQARRKIESQMTDWCVIGDEAPSGPIDPDTLEYPEDIVQPVYEGPCQFKAANVAVREIAAQAQQLVETIATLKLPVNTNPLIKTGSSTAVQKNHVARITVGSHDPQMAAVKVRITGPHHQTFSTARRFPVEETT